MKHTYRITKESVPAKADGNVYIPLYAQFAKFWAGVGAFLNEKEDPLVGYNPYNQ